MWTTETVGEHSYPVWQPVEPVRFVILWLNTEPVVVPHGWAIVRWPSDTWHLTKAEEVQLTDVLLPWIGQRWGVTSRGIAMAGTGPGGQAALRWGFRFPDRFGAIAAIQPWIEFEQLFNSGSFVDELFPRKETARQANAILALNSAKVPAFVWFSSDPADELWHRGADRLHEKLAAIGHEHLFIERNSSVDEMLYALAPALQTLSRRLM
jgi:pimeloyl-ACP methyl ester carboxylesterase